MLQTPYVKSLLDLQEKTIRKAQDGDEQAFRHIFDACSSIVYSISLRYMKDEDEARDLMQEVFIRLFKKIKEFKFQGSFDGWLKRMTVNMAIDEIRKGKPWIGNERIEDQNDLQSEFSAEDILGQLSASELLEIIRELPKVYGLVFNMYVIEGFKHAEIAKFLGISEGTSKSNLHDARKLLQKRVNNVLNG